jgi:hypothetical protein
MSKTPSIAVIPSGYKASKVYSVLPTNGDADLDFTRNCTAIRVNQNGLLEEVGLNVPRLDYSDGGCPSLLFEPQTTNLFSNSGWKGGGAKPTDWVIRTNSITSTESSIFGGLVTAYNFETSTNILRSYFQSNDITCAVGVDYRFSFFVEKTQGTEIKNFNSITGIYISNVENRKYFENNVEVTQTHNFTEGNYYSMTFNVPVEVIGYFRLGIGANNNFVADNSITLSQPSLVDNVLNSSFILTPIGATVTRLQDEASKNNLESYINSSEGVLYLETKSLTDNADGFYRISLVFDSSSNVVRFTYVPNINEIRAEVIVGGSTQFVRKATSLDITTYLKVAIKYKENEFSLWIDGTKLGSSNVGSIFSSGTLNELAFASGSNGNPYSGKIKDLRVYNEALTDDELIALTQ